MSPFLGKFVAYLYYISGDVLMGFGSSIPPRKVFRGNGLS